MSDNCVYVGYRCSFFLREHRFALVDSLSRYNSRRHGDIKKSYVLIT